MTNELEGNLPMDSRLAWQLAQATIKGPTEAIVELVTNAEDAYVRGGINGDISIFMHSVKGPNDVVAVADEAGGMNLEQLQSAIVFGKRSSGQAAGSGIRGFFGRGLKESILALGRGEIATVRDGQLFHVRIFREGSEPRFKFTENPSRVAIGRDIEARTGLALPQLHGTIVVITFEKEVTVPREENLRWQVENHYALRKILSKPGRKVFFTYRKARGAQTRHVLAIKPPQSELVLETDLDLMPGLVKAHLRLYESPQPLSEPKLGLEFSQAGLLITADGIPLENTLFGFEVDAAGHYFHGDVEVPYIAERLQADDFGILTPHRDGLDWRSGVCLSLKNKCVAAIGPLIEKKRKQLSAPAKELGDEHKKRLARLCKLLNELYDDFDSETPGLGPGGEVQTMTITDLTILPEFSTVKENRVRSLSVYYPRRDASISLLKASISADGFGADLLDTAVDLLPHPTDAKLLYGSFRVEGKTNGQKIVAKAKVDVSSAYANIEVTEDTKRGRPKKDHTGRGGPFSGIDFDYTEEPIQPVRYDGTAGRIILFAKFPFVALYLGNGPDGLNDPATHPVFADLIGEAFCKQLARKGIDTGRYPTIQGSEIDNYDSAFNEQRRRVMKLIHQEVASVLAGTGAPKPVAPET